VQPAADTAADFIPHGLITIAVGETVVVSFIERPTYEMITDSRGGYTPKYLGGLAPPFPLPLFLLPPLRSRPP